MTATAAHLAPTRQACADPALPGLALALDPALVGGLLARAGALPAGTQVAIRHVRYHPGRGAWITYTARSGRQAGGGRLFYGRLDAPGVEPLAGHERRPAGESAVGIALPAVPMVVRFFPHDAVLRRLPEICELDEIKRQVEAVLAAESIDWKIKRTTAKGVVVRYKPERRCVLRLHLDARGRASHHKRRLALYGQVDTDGAGARVAALLQDLRAAEGAMGPIAVARLVLHDPRLELLLQEEIEGTPLPAHLDRDDAKKVVRRLVGRLVDLQRSGARPPRRLDLEDRLRAAGETETTLASVGDAAARGLDARAAAVRRTLAERAEPAPVTGCVHGDFHAGQVLVRGRRSWIVDFDCAATGDPLIDPATFVANLRLEVEAGRISRAPARRASKVFLRAYAGAWPAAFDAARLRWHAAAILLAEATAPLRQLQAGWPERVGERLRLAEAIAEGGEVVP